MICPICQSSLSRKDSWSGWWNCPSCPNSFEFYSVNNSTLDLIHVDVDHLPISHLRIFLRSNKMEFCCKEQIVASMTLPQLPSANEILKQMNKISNLKAFL